MTSAKVLISDYFHKIFTYKAIARQVADRLQRVTYPLTNLSRNLSGLATIGELGSTFLQQWPAMIFRNHCKLQHEIATCNMSISTFHRFLFLTVRDKLQGDCIM